MRPSTCRWAIRRWAGTPASHSALALAQPNRRVVLFDSEGDILMSLGMLATIAEQAPANFYHFLLDNECYATTGGQPVPNAKNVAYDALARGAGYPRAFAFDELDEFTRGLPGILAAPGPVFVALKVLPEVENTPIGRRSRWQTRTRDKVRAGPAQGTGSGDIAMNRYGISRRGVLALGGGGAGIRLPRRRVRPSREDASSPRTTAPTTRSIRMWCSTSAASDRG